MLTIFGFSEPVKPVIYKIVSGIIRLDTVSEIKGKNLMTDVFIDVK